MMEDQQKKLAEEDNNSEMQISGLDED